MLISLVAIATPCLAVELFGPQLGLRTGSGSSHAVRADFDGNGVPDFAVANRGDGTVRVVLGDGLGGFDATPAIWVYEHPTSIAAGDFNDDGAADLAVAYVDFDILSLLLGDGSGHFDQGKDIPTGSRPQFVAAADFDFDGDDDLVAANSDDDTVSILLSDGNGGFTPGATIPVGTFPHFIAVDDLNLDGDPDLVVANSWSDSVSILLGNGSGGFDTADTVFVGQGRAPSAVAVDDFDLDGTTDLAVTGGADDSLSIWLGDGTGRFRLAQEIADLQVDVRQAPVWIATGDFDADGDSDLVVANLWNETIHVWANDPLRADGEHFILKAEIAIPMAPRSILVGDFTNDGALDLALVLVGGRMTIFPGDGFGGFVPVKEILFQPGEELTCPVAADFNGDGNADVAVASGSANSVMVALGDGKGFFDVENMTAREIVGASCVAAEDFDADGNLDLAVDRKLGQAEPGSVQILLGDGSGDFMLGSEVATGASPSQFRGMASGDFDLDGDVDLAVANNLGGSVSVLVNDGSGDFLDTDTRTFRVGIRPNSPTSADFNRDGLLDLAVPNLSSNWVTIHLGTGNAEFTVPFGGPRLRIDSPEEIAAYYKLEPAQFGAPLTSEGVSGRVVLADDEVNEFTDELGRYWPHGTTMDACQPLAETAVGLIVMVLRGNCAFTTKARHAQDAGAIAMIIANDRPGLVLPGGSDLSITIPSASITQVDGNLIKDVTLTSPVEATLLVKPDEPGQVLTVSQPISLVAGDFNDDGITDLAAAGYSSGTVSILAGDGEGRFVVAQEIPVGSSNLAGLAMADFNGDGLDDLAYALHVGHVVGVLVNRGEGQFTSTPVFFVGSTPWAIAAADLDGDVTPDLLTASNNLGTVSLLYNRIHERVDPNGSNRVDGFDLAEISRLAAKRLGDGEYRRSYDVDLNGTIDGDDLHLVAERFGDLMKVASPLSPEFEPPVTLDPNTVTLQSFETAGDLLTLEIVANDLEEGVSGAEFAVTFEPVSSDNDRSPVLDAIGFDSGDLFSGGVTQAYEVDTGPAGRTEVSVNRIPREDRVGTGRQTILKLKLRALRTGTANLEFAAVGGRAAPALLDASGNPVPGVSFVGGGQVRVETTQAEVVGQRIAFAPPLVEFGDVPPGLTTSAELRLSNFGFSDLRVSAVTSGRPEFRSFFTSPFTIPPYGTVALPVQFAPSGRGVFAEKLVVRSDDPSRPEVRVPVFGRSEPSLVVSPAHVDFGVVLPGVTVKRKVGITNRGDTSLELTDVTVSDARVAPEPQFTTLGSGESGTLQVEFSPVRAGQDLQGTLTLGFGDASEIAVVISLSGSVTRTPEAAMRWKHAHVTMED